MCHRQRVICARTTTENSDVIYLEQERPPFLSFELFLDNHCAAEGELLRFGIKKMTILEK